MMFLSTLLVLVILIIYSLLGAVIFQLLEGGASPTKVDEPHDVNNNNEQINVKVVPKVVPKVIPNINIDKLREDVVKIIIAASKTPTPPSGQNATTAPPPPRLKLPDVIRAELKRYQGDVEVVAIAKAEAKHAAAVEAIEAAQDEDVEDAEVDSDGGPAESWDFWGSLFYCMTIYTTIGYGHIAPVTDAGRIATIVYALIGIPLCLIVLDGFGKLLTKSLKFGWAIVFRSYRVDDDFNFLPLVALGITTAYILAGADMYRQWEDWEYMDAIYFIFITISTVGFGDILPSCPGYFLASFVYVLVGLALVGMLINIMMESIGKVVDKLKLKILGPEKTKID